jgi:hypothetical protein
MLRGIDSKLRFVKLATVSDITLNTRAPHGGRHRHGNELGFPFVLGQDDGQSDAVICLENITH